MAEKTENAFLGTEKLGTLMHKYAVPCVISLLVAAINNINGQYNKRPCRGASRHRSFFWKAVCLAYKKAVGNCVKCRKSRFYIKFLDLQSEKSYAIYSMETRRR